MSKWFGGIHEGSLRGGTMALIACTFGAGCFTYPYAFMNVRLIPSIIIHTFVSLSMTFTLHLILELGLEEKIYNFLKSKGLESDCDNNCFKGETKIIKQEKKGRN